MMSWLRRLSSYGKRSPQRTPIRKNPPRAQLTIEPLENRAVPAVYLVPVGSLLLRPMILDDALMPGISEVVAARLPQVSFGLDAASDTGTPGDLNTTRDTVNLVGQTGAGFHVRLLGTNITATADAQGNFTLPGVSLAPGVNDLTVQVTDPFGTPGQTSQAVYRDSAPTVAAQLQDITVGQDAEDTVFSLASVFGDVDIQNSIVRFRTLAGDIDVELFDNNGPASNPTRTTPLTVTNFLNHLNAGDYQNSIFHRVVPNFVLQGGGYSFNAATHTLPKIAPTAPTVSNEPGILNKRGTIAMAKLDGNPNSATTEFFFNLKDNTTLDNPSNNGGFTAFGQVLGDDMQVVDRIAAVPKQPQASPFQEIPLKNFPSDAQFPADLEASNLEIVQSILLVHLRDQLSFSVTSSDPDLVQASMNGDNLTLDYQPGQTGTATITVRATDREGLFVEASFQVTVEE